MNRDHLIRRKASTTIMRWTPVHPDEPPHGFMMRIAERHRQPSAAKFVDHVGFDDVTDLRACMVALGASPCANPEDMATLSRWVPETLKGSKGYRRSFGGETIGHTDWSVSSRRFCPGCLAEAPYHRAWFDLTFMATCPVHGTPIIDRAPDGAAVGFATASIDTTSSGHKLSHPVPRLAGPVRTLEAYALARLGLRDRWSSPAIDPLDLGEVVLACELVGCIVLGGHRELKPTPADLGRTQDEVVAEGFAVLDAGPGEVVERLAGVAGSAPAGTYGARSLFGWAYGTFGAGTAGLLSIRDLLMDAAHSTGRAGTRHSSKRRGEARYVTLTTIAEAYGLKRDSLRNVATGLGCLHGNEAWGKPLLVQALEVPSLVEAFQWGLKRDVAADALGVGEDAMNDLVRAGHVRSTWRGADGDRADRFHHGSLLAFVESLPFERLPIDDAMFHSDPPPVALSSILDRLRTSDLDVVGEVMSGNVTLYAATDAPGSLGEFVVGWEADVMRHPLLMPLRAAWKTRISRASETAMTKREACTVLGVSPPTIPALIDSGHLAMIDGKGTKNRTALDRRSVHEFAAKYLASKFYAEAIGMKTQFLTPKAERAGIFDLLHDLRRERADSMISILYERTTMTRFLGLPEDPDKALSGRIAWTRFATHLGYGRSGFMVWSVVGEREAVCAMRLLRWKVRLRIADRGRDGSCVVTASLTLGKRDEVDPRRIAEIVTTRDRPHGLTFDYDPRTNEIEATLLSKIEAWTADATGGEPAPGEDDVFHALSGILMTLRTFFDDGATTLAGGREAA